MKKKRDGDRLFWISYSDLMTSLFFVMMIMFAIMAGRNMKLTRDNRDLNGQLDSALITLTQQKKYIDIVKQFKPLKESGSFIYMEDANKYVARDFMDKEIFDREKDAIKPEFRERTMEIGKEVEDMLKKLNEENPDYSYLLVIEGNAANTYDKKIDIDDDYGYKLSYRRALAVYQLWRMGGINLRKYNTETLIAGSGFNGLFREKFEDNNKRFTIQILPKISDPDAKN